MSLWDWIKGPTNPDSETLRDIERSVQKIRVKLEDVEIKLFTITAALKRVEEKQMAQSEIVARLVQETSETKGKVASVLAFVRGVPDLVREAVEEALAANPGLSQEDLAAITQVADDLDAAQGEIEAALNANSGGEGEGESEEDQPDEPFPAPVE